MCRSSYCHIGSHIHLAAILVFLMLDIKRENYLISLKLCPKVTVNCKQIGSEGILLEVSGLCGNLTQDHLARSHTTAQSGQPETQGDVEKPRNRSICHLFWPMVSGM